VARALAATATDRVLDVGCGTGGFCPIVPGRYVGIDPDAGAIAFARWRWADPRRRFAVARLVDLDGGEGFDRAIMVNCLHHLAEADAQEALVRLAKLVRTRLVLADADPEHSNRLQRFLLAHDRGAFIRPVAQQRAMLAASFRIVAEERFCNTPRTAVQALFVCEPRPGR
jgi:SAM-dependent methyltransferase